MLAGWRRRCTTRDILAACGTLSKDYQQNRTVSTPDKQEHSKGRRKPAGRSLNSKEVASTEMKKCKPRCFHTKHNGILGLRIEPSTASIGKELQRLRSPYCDRQWEELELRITLNSKSFVLVFLEIDLPMYCITSPTTYCNTIGSLSRKKK